MVNPEQLWPSSQSVLGYVSEIFGKPEPVPKERILPLTEGAIDLGKDQTLKVFETLGHASHNLSFLESFNGGVFPGDAAGTYFPEFDVVVPTTPPPFRLESALDSLDKIINVNPTALYYSHFGRADNAVQRLRITRCSCSCGRYRRGVAKNLSNQEIRDRIIPRIKRLVLLIL
jgi:glyoxylase-like metal-dependent hydrolase (beta-lactamase superfamily II)